ncbi:Valine--pyruvate aminotransferase [Planctomycetes bacterium CA13]|uniref:Valine--pyruvate aminotransferase n=1 Tax=Novipirellula herctigrandis TaxID=2527986 RepID=A0A5C5Z7A3_9BACT|nr:Valine--pyruvate aminotransferase [Planctomycetes bacterium CA13]
MVWELSKFGQQLGCGSGIGELMDDLGHALAKGGDRVRMLGGGQPAHIPHMDTIWRKRMQEIVDEPGQLEHALGHYEPPAGNPEFRVAVANLFREEFGWDVGAENIGVTAGGQTAFFMLFNALAGSFQDGKRKKILLPLVPEYIGYANQSVDSGTDSGDSLFHAVKPRIEMTGDHEFKYRVDFDALELTDDIAAVCVSRPTNPTGNVLTDAEVEQLADLCSEKQIPLIIDNAYGAPFPGAIYTEVTPVWNENIILTLSLSKLGLPGTRTGIVIAQPEVIRWLSSMMSIIGLANANIGQALVAPLIENREVLRLSKEVVQPFYSEKSRQAQSWVREFFDDSLPYQIHRNEGAFFLWMWFKDLPITSFELYERLKQRDVLVVPGNYFFFGLDDSKWRHRDECIRVTFTMPEETVRDGYRIIAEEVSKAYAE